MSGMTAPSSLNQNFLLETSGLTLEFLSDILLDIQTIGEFSSEKEYFWNKRLLKLTADVSQFVELTTLLSKAVLTKSHQSFERIKASHVHLLFVLKGMNQAQLKQDYVALEELIKYELKDNLTQWKIDLIPQIKKVLNT